MKFNRMVVIIGVCSLLCCSKQDNNLSGTWIGAYYFVPGDSIFRSKFTLNWLVEVSDDALNVTTLKLDGVRPPNRLTSLRYGRTGNQIFINFDKGVDSIEIVSQNDDSLVLKYHGEGDANFVFKKFARGASPKMPTLSGKSFNIFSGNYKDSVSFLTDSVFINISRGSVQGNRWTQTAVHKYSFVLLGEQGPPLYVRSIKNDTVTLENFGAGNKYIFLVRLGDKNLSLEGHWEEVGRLYTKDFPPPPGAGKMKLTFGADSCEISYGARHIKRRWRLNSTAEILYFNPINKVNDWDWAWHVERAGDSLIVDRWILLKDEANDFDPGGKIVFKKKE
jgi:hypothetical protein